MRWTNLLSSGATLPLPYGYVIHHESCCSVVHSHCDELRLAIRRLIMKLCLTLFADMWYIMNLIHVWTCSWYVCLIYVYTYMCVSYICIHIYESDTCVNLCPTDMWYIMNHVAVWCMMCVWQRGGWLGSRPKKMYGERLGDGVEYHSMKPTPRRQVPFTTGPRFHEISWKWVSTPAPHLWWCEERIKSKNEKGNLEGENREIENLEIEDLYSRLQIRWHRISKLCLKLFQRTRILPMGFTISTK